MTVQQEGHRLVLGTMPGIHKEFMIGVVQATQKRLFPLMLAACVKVKDTLQPLAFAQLKLIL